MREYIYVMTNETMPNLVKVGFSSKDPILRAVELGGTHNPKPYILEYYLFVDANAQKIEHKAQEILKEQNYWERPSLKGQGQEWFKCQVVDAISSIQKASSYFTQTILEEKFVKIEAQKAAEKRKKEEDTEEQKRIYDRNIKNIERLEAEKCQQKLKKEAEERKKIGKFIDARIEESQRIIAMEYTTTLAKI